MLSPTDARNRRLRLTLTALSALGLSLALLVAVVTGGGGSPTVALENDDASTSSEPFSRRGSGIDNLDSLANEFDDPGTDTTLPPSGPGGQVVVNVASPPGSGTPSGGGGNAPPPQGRTANGPAAPRIDQFFAEPAQPNASEDVTFRWWAGDADGQIDAYQVDFGDGERDAQVFADRCVQNPSDPVQERTPFRHSYAQPGSYRVVLLAYSSGSCGNGPLQVTRSEVQVRVGVGGVVPPTIPG